MFGDFGNNSPFVSNRSLRRKMQGFDTATKVQFAREVSRPGNGETMGLARDTLNDLANYENAAAPVEERQQLEEQLKDANLTGSQRDILNQKLRDNDAGFGSIKARFAPQNYGSIASRRFSSLYRNR